MRAVRRGLLTGPPQIRNSVYYFKIFRVGNKHLVIKSHKIIWGWVRGENWKRFLFLVNIYLSSLLPEIFIISIYRVFLF